ncbi:hypothetical protein Poli38472_005289 [Pythium oligandrum]|uniref:Uncharacterized protein n=1 Tax=Pythium oligandrum TaxID=41045 RepID=A0A8K1FHF6_PYTOL|nr:hypothetical protein Poli38472_005289 [Pythium oligandrum]|eukprot:TMW62671.1 hypothetical protein Poli38472_005289 [Pythium oligandrum]
METQRDDGAMESALEAALTHMQGLRLTESPLDTTELLRLQVEQLKTRLEELVHEREDDDVVFQRAMAYAAAKGTANAVLHTLFDQASAGKYQVLASWFETGVIPTRDGLKHWRLDLRDIRNELGATILHVAVDASMARQNLKVKLVELLVDRVGFDVNARDAFGRTPLHVAAMSGHVDVTKALLARGADPTRRDRAGLTPLSVVRTLSRPPEDVVQVLVDAENAKSKLDSAILTSVSPKKAITSALFLQSLSPFVRPEHAKAFTAQVDALLGVLSGGKQAPLVGFDSALLQHVPILFDLSDPVVTQLARLESLLVSTIYRDAVFQKELKIEAAGYGVSLVTASSSSLVAPSGATWVGWLLKLVQGFKHEVASSAETSLVTSKSEREVFSEMSESGETSSISSVSERSVVYTDPTTSASRQAWHYAVLFKAATHPFPGALRVTRGEDTVVSSEDVSRFFPLEDRLLINGAEYHCVAYDVVTRQIRLDRPYEGVNGADVKAYLAGSCSSVSSPYVTTRRIWERPPGNKYEDHMSHEQELFQDYQFLDPDSLYEVAVKLGPVPTAAEARGIVEEWKTQVRKHFEAKTCLSGLPSCQHYCPQRSGHSLCVETMAAVGRELAKMRLGRPTFSKALKPRASLQKYQDRFMGTSQWPGSPGSTPRAAPNATDVVMTSEPLDA